MTHYENHAPVSNQVGIQNVYGNLIIDGNSDSYERLRYDNNGEKLCHPSINTDGAQGLSQRRCLITVSRRRIESSIQELNVYNRHS